MATRTGWAFIDGDNPRRMSGCHDYRRSGELPDRLLNFQASLINMFLSYDPDIVVYEIAHHRGGPATRSGIGMETVLIITARKHNIMVHGVHSLSLKKFATGTGKASKDMMIAAASEYDGFGVVEDDNEADAIHLAKWGVQHVELGEHGRAVVKSIKRKRIPRRKKK